MIVPSSNNAVVSTKGQGFTLLLALCTNSCARAGKSALVEEGKLLVGCGGHFFGQGGLSDSERKGEHLILHATCCIQYSIIHFLVAAALATLIRDSFTSRSAMWRKGLLALST